MPRAPAGTDGPSGGPPTELHVKDAEGGPWALDEVPRAPVFELAFASAPNHAEDHLWLLRGAADVDTLEDLVDPPLRATTSARTVPLAVSNTGRLLRATALESLEPGTRYALVLTYGDGQTYAANLRISTSPVAGARLAGTLPADGDARVPGGARRILVVFDGYVRDLGDDTVRLIDTTASTPVPASIEPVPCRALGLPEGDCAWVRPARGLAANSSYSLHVGPGMHDATGAALGAATVSFSTRPPRGDDPPPQLLPTACAPDELSVNGLCVLAAERSVSLRGTLDEPALVSVGTAKRLATSLSGASGFELRMTGLEPGETFDLSLRVEDVAGHVATRSLRLTTAFGLPTVSIDEVRADPLGPEPAQEYVELLNFGREPVQIMGYSLTDDALATGRIVQSSLLLEPGERVLAVAPDFDTRDTRDGELPQGLRLARLDGALSLRNGEGVALILRDALGRRVSESPSLDASAPGQCSARIDGDHRTGEPDAFALDPGGRCTPGRATDSTP